jgi:hypothetical protein
VAWKALAAVGIFVGGVVAAVVTVYSLGWRDDSHSVQTVTVTTIAKTVGAQTHTVRQGDDIRVPAVGVTCHAGYEGAHPNLFCLRYPRGRHSFAFYNDSVEVYGPDAEPTAPSESFDWQPK